jgi:mRNA interferase MazF
MREAYCPDRGDIVWIDFTPQAGHEQAGERPALTLSPLSYNRKIGLAIFCPITTQAKGYPFEVLVPEGLKVRGAILSDQVRNLDWDARHARFYCKLPASTVSEVTHQISALLQTNAKN